MKVIIAGSRGITDRRTVYRAIRESGFEITEVVWGGAPGVDSVGHVWAVQRGIPVKPFAARWRHDDGTPDPRAGFIRNRAMAAYADALIAVWDGHTTGTADMIEQARKRNLLIHIHRVTA